ncbi:winged helix-turn-helix transcriptional regulator [Pseudonocardia broussonetiae]|uniref:Helix-turn-helix transcriptional regulator n=1 Tax=Pseudonocardia broussonetiae TaxID=2736640 RepID=A0A6M6JCA4_9PSEU|nr:helix-turn-helix domain-containing protein [Pseudonocardia broussonetiae]QJY44482.1 helix-turn-helix transcriptional regulator [Pseudonocardia broussonetiae]
MQTYGQFCPIARAAELFAQRWTPVIVRNLLVGCRTFTEIRQGAPGISTALLAQRLDTLERNGVITSRPAPTGRGRWYSLTDMGRELKPVCDALGRWGARWIEVEPHHLDPAYVLWATTRLVDVDRLPDRTVVVRVDLRDRPEEHYWMILHRPASELCTRGTGYTEDLVARTDAACLVDIHLTRTTYADALRCGRLELAGATGLIREFSSWIRPSPFAAHVPGTAAHRAARTDSMPPSR